MRRLVMALVLLTGIATTGWAEEETAKPKVDYGLAAEVLKLDLDQVNATLDQNQQASQTYQNAIIMQHLAQESLRRGLPARYDVSRALHEAEQRVLIIALRADVTRVVPAIEEKDAKAFYKKNRERFQYPDQFQTDAVRLTNATPSMVSETVELLTSTTNWYDKVLDVSSNAVVMATQASGTWYGSNVVEQVIWEALGEMKPDEVRDVKIGEQTVVIRRGDFRKADTMPYEKARDTVNRAARAEREEQMWQDYLAAQRKKLGLPEPRPQGG